MPPNQPSYFSLTEEQDLEVRKFIARGNGYHHIGSAEIPTVIPSAIRAKWDSAAVIVTASTGPNGAFALVGHRIDAKADQMDQDPFVIAVSGSLPQGRGVLVHHANFPGRSRNLPPDYKANLGSSGLLDYFKYNPPYGVTSGSTGQVPKELVQAVNTARRLLEESDNS